MRFHAHGKPLLYDYLSKKLWFISVLQSQVNLARNTMLNAKCWCVDGWVGHFCLVFCSCNERSLMCSFSLEPAQQHAALWQTVSSVWSFSLHITTASLAHMVCVYPRVYFLLLITCFDTHTCIYIPHPTVHFYSHVSFLAKWWRWQVSFRATNRYIIESSTAATANNRNNSNNE